MKDETQKLVEITRSFSYKLNLGNYEMADFFCSRKEEVPEEQAIEISEKIYEFCKKEVLKSAISYLKQKTEDWSEKKQADYNKSSQLDIINAELQSVNEK